MLLCEYRQTGYERERLQQTLRTKEVESRELYAASGDLCSIARTSNSDSGGEDLILLNFDSSQMRSQCRYSQSWQYFMATSPVFNFH